MEEKRFITPTLEIINFDECDVIFTSGETDVNGDDIENLA